MTRSRRRDHFGFLGATNGGRLTPRLCRDLSEALGFSSGTCLEARARMVLRFPTWAFRGLSGSCPDQDMGNTSGACRVYMAPRRWRVGRGAHARTLGLGSRTYSRRPPAIFVRRQNAPDIGDAASGGDTEQLAVALVVIAALVVAALVVAAVAVVALSPSRSSSPRSWSPRSRSSLCS